MLGTVLTRLQAKVTSVISYVTTLTQQLLSKIIGVLTEIKTRFADSLTSLSFLLAQTEQKFKALVVNLTTQVSLIKVALTTVKATLTQIGLLLLTTVRQTHQLVLKLLKKGK